MNILMRCLPAAALLVNLLPAAAAKPSQVTLEVLNPMGVIEPPATLGLSPRVADLAGRKIALMQKHAEDEPYIDPHYMWRMPN